MQNRIRLPLMLALAKSVQEYLAAHDGDASAALSAAQRDIVQREGQNSSARAFQRAYTKLVEDLKLPTSPDDADAASDAALSAVRSLTAAGATSSQIAKTLSKLGLDPAKLEEQVSALKAQAEQGAEGAALKRQLAYRDAADALGYDAGKLVKVLRDEQALPVKRSVTTTDDTGLESTKEVWGIPSIDASGKETGFTALNQHPEVRGFEAALRREAAPVQAGPGAPLPGYTAPVQVGQTLFTQPSLPPQRAGAAPAMGDVRLSGNPADQLIGGAGSI